MDRRSFLKLGAAGTATALFPALSFASTADPVTEKSLSFYNTHTGETLVSTYWEAGNYIPESLRQINHILRDHRTGELMPMNVELIDLLYDVRTKLGSSKPFGIISGYRSPKSNAMLNATTSGVASKSLHTQGMAIDVNLSGVELSQLRKAAMSEKKGGVGFYPSSNFVHLDVGRVRYW